MAKTLLRWVPILSRAASHCGSLTYRWARIRRLAHPDVGLPTSSVPRLTFFSPCGTSTCSSVCTFSFGPQFAPLSAIAFMQSPLPMSPATFATLTPSAMCPTSAATSLDPLPCRSGCHQCHSAVFCRSQSLPNSACIGTPASNPSSSPARSPITTSNTATSSIVPFLGLRLTVRTHRSFPAFQSTSTGPQGISTLANPATLHHMPKTSSPSPIPSPLRLHHPAGFLSLFLDAG